MLLFVHSRSKRKKKHLIGVGKPALRLPERVLNKRPVGCQATVHAVFGASSAFAAAASLGSVLARASQIAAILLRRARRARGRARAAARARG
jgi:precorrin-2 methylase